MNCNRTFPYVPIARFGAKMDPVFSIDPVASSVYKDIDSDFDIGEMAINYGPRTKKSMLFMADKCSKKWDGACEFLSRNEDSNAICNQARISSPLFRRVNAPGTQTIGDILVENSAVRRFCDLSSCAVTSEPYDPTNPYSVWTKQYGCCGSTVCMPVCMPPDEPDKDILLNKVLDKPHLHLDLLINMYKNVNQQGLRAKFTANRVGRIFAIFDTYVKMHGSLN